MKKNKVQLKWDISLLALITLFIIISYTSISYANTSNEIQFIGKEINSKYLEWEQLSEEEKANTIMPSLFSIPIKSSVKRSTYNKVLKLGSTITTPQYDLRTKLSEILVKNQQQTGSCWAFSTSSMIETTIAKKYNKTSQEYSPMHLEYYVSNTFNKSVGDGANAYIATAYLASGIGPVYESDLPFSSVYDEENNLKANYYLKDKSEVSLDQTARAQLIDATYFASIYKSYDSSTNKPIYMDANDNEYTEAEVEILRNSIKEHIQNYGGVVASYYAPTTATENTKFYNETNSSYYCNDSSLTANHQILIIGWDDTYDNEKFNKENMPANNGAWIILNSWGTEQGDNGYMYISYDDCHIEEQIVGIVDIDEFTDEDTVDYTLYEYDQLGSSYTIAPSNTQNSAYTANVFTRQNLEKDESLSKVGIFLDSTEGIEIYVNSFDSTLTDLISEENKVATLTGTNALTPGYHLIDITPVKLTGNKFVVGVKYINEEGPSIPLECNLKDSNLQYFSNYFDTATANEGESFISIDGSSWSDINGLKIGLIYTLKNTNACIKAYTEEQEPEPAKIPVTGVSVFYTSSILEVNDTVDLQITVTPDNATNKNVTCVSSNANVATVSESGIVTAVAEGTATITITTEDGGFTATSKIVVKNEEKEEKEISVTGVTLDKTTATIKEGATVKLTPTIAPENATNKNVTWTSSNESVATVAGGVVTGVKAGTATITATTVDGNKIATCTVTVEEIVQSVSVTSVSLNVNTLEMQVGDEYTLVATLNPKDASNKDVTWTSSDEKVVEVSANGIITAKKEGTATVTVTTKDGEYQDSVKITVIKKTNTDDDVYTDKDEGKDGTTVTDPIPKTGETILTLGLIVIVLVLGFVSVIKFKKYNLK